MGLSCCAIELIIQEHLHKPLGNVLLIGRQNVDVTAAAMDRILSHYKLSPREPYALEQAGTLAHDVRSRPKEAEPITDVSVFRALGDYTVTALDISDYEGAEIIHDMSLPLPDDLKGRFDFIYDGSCMDNIFDGPQALINMADLLRPGGRVLAYNASNSAPTAYLQYSPDWFIDYFAVNGYDDCKAYVLELPRNAQPVRPEPLPVDIAPQHGCFWHYNPYVQLEDGSVGYLNSHIDDTVERYIYILAEKGQASTSDRAPVQMQYRGSDTAIYNDAIERWQRSRRPIYEPRTGEQFEGASLSGVGSVHPLMRWHRRSPTLPNESQLVVELRRQKNEAQTAWRRVEHEKNQRIIERDQYLMERDQLRQERDRILAERDEAVSDLRRTQAEHAQTRTERDRALTERDQSQSVAGSVDTVRSVELARVVVSRVANRLQSLAVRPRPQNHKDTH